MKKMLFAVPFTLSVLFWKQKYSFNFILFIHLMNKFSTVKTLPQQSSRFTSAMYSQVNKTITEDEILPSTAWFSSIKAWNSLSQAGVFLLGVFFCSHSYISIEEHSNNEKMKKGLEVLISTPFPKAKIQHGKRGSLIINNIHIAKKIQLIFVSPYTFLLEINIAINFVGLTFRKCLLQIHFSFQVFWLIKAIEFRAIDF